MLYKFAFKKESKICPFFTPTMSALSPILIICIWIMATSPSRSSCLQSRFPPKQPPHLSKGVSFIKYILLIALPCLKIFFGSPSKWIWWILCLLLQPHSPSFTHWWLTLPNPTYTFIFLNTLFYFIFYPMEDFINKWFLKKTDWELCMLNTSFYFTTLFLVYVIPPAGILENRCCLLVINYSFISSYCTYKTVTLLTI